MIVIMSEPFQHLFNGARSLVLEQGQTLFLTGDPVALVHLVQSGKVALLRRTPQGGTLRLQLAGPGEVLAEASVWSAHYHCDAEADGPATLLSVPVTRFRHRLTEDAALAEAWARHLARSVQAARFRAALLALRGVAERLDAWVAEGHDLPPHGAIQTLAADLGVTREALYRVLSRRRHRGDRT